MYSLQLSPEQLEIRDTMRDFVTRELKPAALKAERLDVTDRRLLTDLLDQASQMGLRSLALSEERGGAGADALTSCIVTEELAAGDADIAAVLSESSRLAHLLFDAVRLERRPARRIPAKAPERRPLSSRLCRP
jgi:alkylation response protein AidB-like acyl-CoA dehydrogenase